MLVGDVIGPYQVLAKLGEGGMGEVYRARDSRLGRDVALKILPEAFAADPDRLARFEREARTLASLNHPHIAQVFGVEDFSSGRALVMELVDGEDLSARIARGPVALDEALPLAREIAEALQAAHEAGIVHRDLKPANVKVRPDGTVKVLDFGLARPGAAGAAGGPSSPDVTGAMTSPAVTMHGVILGTAAYMAPEQAKGRAVDKRADVWAFGCVFYEMLTGRRAFPGEDVSETLASILAREPDYAALPPVLPPALRTLIVRCLTRDPRQRVADFSTVIYVLQGGLEAPAAAVPAAAPPAPRPLWRRALPALAAAIAAGALGLTAGTLWLSAPPSRTVTRFSFWLPPGIIYTNNNRQLLDVSPDGTRIVFVAGLRLYLRDLAEPEARPIPGSDQRVGVLNPTFSPDGSWIAFWSGNALMKVPAAGGPPITIYTANAAAAAAGLTWDASGLVVGMSRGISRVSPDGGEPVVLVAAREGEVMYRPQMLPDGRHMLYTRGMTDRASQSVTAASVVVQRIGSDETTTIVQGVDGRYLSTGHLLYRSGETMMAARFDLERLSTIGSPVAIAEPAASSGASPLASHLAVSSLGTLVYVVGSGSAGQDLAVLDRRGNITRQLGLPEGAYATPRVSPDGRQIAYSERGDNPNIWIVNFEGGTPPRRLTFSGQNRFPVWSADGTHLAFESNRGGDRAIYWQRADGSGEAERLTTPESGTTHAPEAFSPDGEHLVFRASGAKSGGLWWWSRRDRSVHPVDDIDGLTGGRRPGNATFSPDGRWLAYTDPQAVGGVSIVRAFPPTAARYQVPMPKEGAGMAIHPVWSRKTGELIYSVGPGMIASAPIDTKSTVEFGAPSVIQIPGTGDVLIRSWDITPDGQHIVRVVERNLTGTLSPPINVVMNWFDELNARVPVR